MADWTNLPNQAVGVGGLPSGTTVTALRDNPVAIAQGAAGAPRVQGSARSFNTLATATITTSVSSVTITDLPPHDGLFFATTAGITNGNTADFIIEVSSNNGSSWTQFSSINQSNGTGRIVNSVVYAVGETSAFGFFSISSLDGGASGVANVFGDFSDGFNAIRLRVSAGTMTAGSLVVYADIKDFE